MQIILRTGVKADVGMDDEGDTEEAVDDGGTGAGGDGCAGGEGDERCGEETLEGPVVGAV